jgi:hypothetical protein
MYGSAFYCSVILRTATFLAENPQYVEDTTNFFRDPARLQRAVRGVWARSLISNCQRSGGVLETLD